MAGPFRRPPDGGLVAGAAAAGAAGRALGRNRRDCPGLGRTEDQGQCGHAAQDSHPLLTANLLDGPDGRPSPKLSARVTSSRQRRPGMSDLPGIWRMLAGKETARQGVFCSF